jgi:phage FluMu gp28-like protein
VALREQAAGKPPEPADKNVCPTDDGEAVLRLRPYQEDVFWDKTAGILVLHWSRQIGKSFVLAAWAVYRLMDRPGRLVTVLSNSKENGAEFLLKCAEVCRLQRTRFEMEGLPLPPLDFEDMRMELRIRNRGKVGRIKVLAANPRTARGFSGDLILDEFAFHEDGEAIWEAAEPILASNKDFLCRIASTGNGKHNLFYRMVEGDQIKNEKLKVKNGDGEREPKLENVRPHPGLLPQEKEKVSGASDGITVSQEGSASGESGVAAAGSADTGEIKNEKLKVENSDSENGAARQHGPTDKVALRGGKDEDDDEHEHDLKTEKTSEPPDVGCYEKGGNGGPPADFDFYVEEFRGGVRKVFLPPRPKRERLELKYTEGRNGEGPRIEIVHRPAVQIKNEDCEREPELENVRPHPSPVASQARHELVALQETCAPRNVVPQERGQVSDAQGGLEQAEEGSVSGLSGGGNGKISEPPDVGCYVNGGEENPPCHLGGYRYKSKAGFWVSRVTRTMAHGMGLEIYDSQTRESIMPEQARARALDKAAYDQNYECKFGDESLALLTHELISAAEWDDIGEICEQDWTVSAFERMRQSKGDLFAGLDVGRKVDMSVLTVLERTEGLFWVRGLLRMRDMRLPDQELRLEKICGMRQLKQVCIDMTGLGLGLFEYAQRRLGEHRISGINFASSVSATRVIVEEGRKRESVRVTEALAMELLRAYEERKIRQPRDWQLREDLRKPGKVTTPAGRVSIAAVRDGAGHADHFWSLALALEAAGGAKQPCAFVPLKLRSRQPGILL